MCGNCSDPSQPWPPSELQTPPSVSPPPASEIPTLVEDERPADLINRSWNR